MEFQDAGRVYGTVGVDDVKRDCGFFAGRVGGAGQQVSFEEGNAVESPGGVGEFLDELSFGGGFRMVLVAKLPQMILIGGKVFGGEEGGAAAQAVGRR